MLQDFQPKVRKERKDIRSDQKMFQGVFQKIIKRKQKEKMYQLQKKSQYNGLTWHKK